MLPKIPPAALYSNAADATAALYAGVSADIRHRQGEKAGSTAAVVAWRFVLGFILRLPGGFDRHLVPGVRHLNQPDTIFGRLGALRQRQAFRGITAIVVGTRHPRSPAPSINRRHRRGFQTLVIITKSLAPNRFQLWDVEGSEKGTEDMQDAKTYRQYANDCRRIAQTMNANDKAMMLEMAKVWDERAEEAERMEKNKGDC
jgi:hypothetical protein